MKKKIILISFFLLLIAVTSFFFVNGAIESYRYDMDPANGVDIMKGMEAAMLLVLGGFVVFYELDLFYTLYYFLVKPKTIAKSILHMTSNLSLLLAFFCDPIARALSISEETNVMLALLFVYFALRSACAFVSMHSWMQEE